MINEWFAIWSNWWTTNQPLTDNLWGFPVFYWARIGKIMQFFATFTIIFEIAGYDRVAEYSKSIHSYITFKKVGRFIAKTVTFFFIPLFVGYILFHDFVSNVTKGKFEISSNIAHRFGFFKILFATCYMLAAITLIDIYGGRWIESHGIQVPTTLVVLIWCYIFIPIFYSIIVLLIFSPALFIVIFFSTLLFVMKSPRLSVIMKISAWLIVAIGFQFDLLAS